MFASQYMNFGTIGQIQVLLVGRKLDPHQPQPKHDLKITHICIFKKVVGPVRSRYGLSIKLWQLVPAVALGPVYST